MTEPLVSVLTCYHPSRPNEWLLTAIDCFKSQTWQNKELIIISDTTATSLSAKRNAGIREARGEYIIHFDDDDWSGPRRIEDQMTTLLQCPGYLNPNPVLSSYTRCFWWDRVTKRASFYNCPVPAGGGPMFCYKRGFALDNPWDESVVTSEDMPFVKAALKMGYVPVTDAGDNLVLTQHHLSAQRAMDKTPFALIETRELPAEFRKVMGI